MEAIKIEVTLTAEFLEQLEQHIKHSVSEALKSNIQAIRADQTKLTRDEAAKMLKISLPTLTKHIKKGKIKTQHLGRRVLIPLTEIETFLKQSA